MFSMKTANLKELNRKEIKAIRKMVRKGVEVPDICKEFDIPPEEWRELAIKYDLLK